MNVKTLLIAFLLVDFMLFSLYVMTQVGYVGIWASGLENWGSLQILTDLVIACLLISIWMIADARERGSNPWPFVLITLLAGSIGPLFYLLLRERKQHVLSKQMA